MKNKTSFIVTWIFIPILLLLFWILTPIISQSSFSFTTLSFQDNKTISSQTLQENKPVLGSFIAKENNLGAVEFMLWNSNTYLGYVNLKIKEKGAKNWFYENNFAAVLIGQKLLSPYGFPIQRNSKGKSYDFRLTLINPNPYGIVRISAEKPTFISVYKFDKAELLHDKKELLKFLYEKMLTTYTYPGFLVFSLRYLLPLFIYLFWKIGGKKLFTSKYKFLGIFCAILLIYIVLMDTLDSYIIIYIIPITWFFLMKNYRFNSLQTVYWSFLFLIISLICLIFSQQQMAINAGDIFYGLFLYAIIQRFVELRKK